LSVATSLPNSAGASTCVARRASKPLTLRQPKRAGREVEQKNVITKSSLDRHVGLFAKPHRRARIAIALVLL
jgi:hypothetical protein